VQTEFSEALNEVFQIIGLYPSGTSVNRVLPARSVILGTEPAHEDVNRTALRESQYPLGEVSFIESYDAQPHRRQDIQQLA
jgi:hypothetical protein